MSAGNERNDERHDRGPHTGLRRSWRERLVALERVITPLVVFVSLYVASLVLLWWAGFPFVQWSGLICVTVATVVTIRISEGGRWGLGLAASPGTAIRELLVGILAGVVLIGTCALLVVATTGLRHETGRGFPWLELVVVFVPAVLHEELLFRGYPFQKLLRWRRGVAIPLMAAVFAALHSGNAAVSWIGLTNIFLGGVLLALAYERHMRLWWPVGLHLAWNLMTGPVLGHEVSGYTSMQTLFVEAGEGPVWLTGGDFGIEGSVWMTVVETAGIAALARSNRPERHGVVTPRI